MEDSRKRNKRTLILCFKIIYTEFLKDNKGYSNILDYIEGEFEGEKESWYKIARWAGHGYIKRTIKGITGYYLRSEINS